MIQHGEDEARFSTRSRGTATITVGARLPRPDKYDGCYNCILRDGNVCPEFPKGFKDLSSMGACENWKLRR